MLSRNDAWVNWSGWLAFFLCSLLLYGASTGAVIQWQDAGQYDLRVARGELDDSFGLCRAHPLHFWICTAAAKVLPVPLPLAVGWVSALCGAIGVANVFAIIARLSGSRIAACLAAAGLGVSHSYWRFSSTPGAHIMSAALLTLELWAVIEWDRTRVDRWLVTAFLANGVGFANHNMALLTAPVLLAVLLVALRRRQADWRTLVAAGVVWAGGASIYLWMILQDAWKYGLPSAVHSALVGAWGSEVAGRQFVWAYTGSSVAFTLFSFPNLMLPAAMAGALRGLRYGIKPLSYWFILVSLVIHLVFVLRYNVIAQYTFLLSAYCMISIFSGIGLAILLNKARLRVAVLGLAIAGVLAAPVVYIAVCNLARHAHALGRFARNKPYRDDYRYLLIPWSRGDDSAEKMSREASRLAGTRGMIVAPDGMATWAVEYQLFEQGKTEVSVISGLHPRWVLAHVAAHRPVVFVPRDVDDPPAAPPVGHWKQAGQLYELELARSTGLDE
jgi:hypothetical protein